MSEQYNQDLENEKKEFFEKSMTIEFELDDRKRDMEL
jgi:hypothetical protein